MARSVQLLDVVALTKDLPEFGLQRGQVGTAVEALAPDVFEIEFADNEGHAYALAAVETRYLLVLHYDSSPAVS